MKNWFATKVIRAAARPIASAVCMTGVAVAVGAGSVAYADPTVCETETSSPPINWAYFRLSTRFSGWIQASGGQAEDEFRRSTA